MHLIWVGLGFDSWGRSGPAVLLVFCAWSDRSEEGLFVCLFVCVCASIQSRHHFAVSSVELSNGCISFVLPMGLIRITTRLSSGRLDRARPVDCVIARREENHKRQPEHLIRENRGYLAASRVRGGWAKLEMGAGFSATRIISQGCLCNLVISAPSSPYEYHQSERVPE